MKKAYPTLLWLKASFDATNQRGSAAFYSRLRFPKTGWSAAYPETTGYIIETFLDYFEQTNETWLLDYAKNAADWLLSIQRPSGAFPAGLGEKGEESVFNSGMILFGLCRIFEKTQEKKYFDALQKTVSWLINILEEDGSWKKGSYIQGYTPSYYTRVIWAILKCNVIFEDKFIEEKMKSALNFYKSKVNKNSSVNDWAFEKNKNAFTHTIAYTQRGFLEAGILLNDKESIEIAINIALKINELMTQNGKIAGSYSNDWKGDYSFRCNTGNAQLSLNAARIYEHTNDIFFFDLAKKIFQTVENTTYTLPIKGFNGSINGSSPIWGEYIRFAAPNWAAKFWLDAYLKIFLNQSNNLAL